MVTTSFDMWLLPFCISNTENISGNFCITSRKACTAKQVSHSWDPFVPCAQQREVVKHSDCELKLRWMRRLKVKGLEPASTKVYLVLSCYSELLLKHEHLGSDNIVHCHSEYKGELWTNSHLHFHAIQSQPETQRTYCKIISYVTLAKCRWRIY